MKHFSSTGFHVMQCALYLQLLTAYFKIVEMVKTHNKIANAKHNKYSYLFLIIAINS